MDSSIKILAFLAALAWFLMGAAPQPAPVILISIDTLRADHLSAYGYRKLKTPNIDSYGQVFTDINSQIPLTLPSHTALMTSTYPFENGVEENAEQVPAGAVTLASVLKAHGYQTAAFVGSNMLDKKFGLDAGFDEYDPVRTLTRPESAATEPSCCAPRPPGSTPNAISPSSYSSISSICTPPTSLNRLASRTNRTPAATTPKLLTLTSSWAASSKLWSRTDGGKNPWSSCSPITAKVWAITAR
jgi:arylsulfatase A-like enzyme